MRKKLSIILITMLFSFTASSKDITGKWYGLLGNFRFVFNISKNDNGYSSTIDNLDQNEIGLPVTTTTFNGTKLKLEIPKYSIEFTGELKDNSIIGVYKQNKREHPMNLSKNPIKKQLQRPQEPKKPYPYYTEDVTFPNNKENIKLAGTLTLPEKNGNFPAVILITGSGPQNRDEELAGHKLFLVISDYLTRNGIAVLRYDDRGFGESEGNFQTATLVDFASDVESAISYLKSRKEINKNQIGLIGHSEGGIIAPMVASKIKDISFIILLSGNGIRGDKILLLQSELIARAQGIPEKDIQATKMINSKLCEIIVKSENPQNLKNGIKKYLKEIIKDSKLKIPKGLTENEYITNVVNVFAAPGMVSLLKYDPAIALEKIKCPVLALNGEKDLQGPSNVNLPAIKKALEKGGNKNITIKEYPNLNHLFQECKTGSPREYIEIEQTFSPAVLKDMTDWIKKQIENK